MYSIETLTEKLKLDTLTYLDIYNHMTNKKEPYTKDEFIRIYLDRVEGLCRDSMWGDYEPHIDVYTPKKKDVFENLETVFNKKYLAFRNSYEWSFAWQKKNHLGFLEWKKSQREEFDFLDSIGAFKEQ